MKAVIFSHLKESRYWGFPMLALALVFFNVNLVVAGAAIFLWLETNFFNRAAVLYVKRLQTDAEMPTRATPDSAGLDLYAATNALLKAKTTMWIATELKTEIPEGHVGFLMGKSGLIKNHSVVLANGAGIIDADYRGVLTVGLKNESDEDFEIQVGDKIAQLVILKYTKVQVEPANELSVTFRGENGFGSTKKRRVSLDFAVDENKKARTTGLGGLQFNDNEPFGPEFLTQLSRRLQNQ